ncbi:MAG: hypothetical protein GX228_07575 [Firmicutes bacterium]|jgi:hypothetical protein|nr:hypothetical protein [Bacillota bacterium]NLL88771.1 hypothetical protein [Bacillota bacterium]HKM17823.1 hypothetical protein [Limnochordia bacterium]
MQKSYESLWEGVKRFFSFRFLLGVRIAEILYFIGFVLITVYGIRILAFLISDDRFYRNCFGFLPRGQLITAVLILFPIAHLVWRMFFEGYVVVIRALNATESVDSKLHKLENPYGDGR